MSSDASPVATASNKVETEPFGNSSYLSSGQYDPVNLTLTINFQYGGVRQYRPVYPQTWMDLKLSPSKGKFFHEAIRKTMGEGMRIK